MGISTPSSLSYISDASLVSSVFLCGGYKAKAVQLKAGNHITIFSLTTKKIKQQLNVIFVN